MRHREARPLAYVLTTRKWERMHSGSLTQTHRLFAAIWLTDDVANMERHCEMSKKGHIGGHSQGLGGEEPKP